MPGNSEDSLEEIEVDFRDELFKRFAAAVAARDGAKLVELKAELKKARVTGRSRGDCSMCCKVFDIPELDKPAHRWCRHCRPGKGGCSIYDSRPAGCREFSCLWLNGHGTADWYPPKSKIVMRMIPADDGGAPILEFHVDANYPNRWREEPYYDAIKRASAIGLMSPDGEEFRVQVIVKDDTFSILPKLVT
jgi:Fe-S-cluster containining protein